MADRVWWPRAWLYWLAALIGSFAVLEDIGYRGKHPTHPTLSRFLARHLGRLGRWVARQLGLGPHDSHRWIGPALFAAAWAGLAVHIAMTDVDDPADDETKENTAHVR